MLGHRNNMGFGNLTSLRPINTTTNTTNNNNKIKKPKVPKTRVIRISESLYERFHQHARKYYNVEPYETILENLLDCYDKHNDTKWF